jgi:hypothetical protein
VTFGGWVGLAFTAISALGGIGGLVGLLYVRATRTEINARARNQNVQADVLLSQEWRDRYEWVAKQAKAADAEARRAMRHVEALEAYVHVLKALVRSLGGDAPEFVPPVDTGETRFDA